MPKMQVYLPEDLYRRVKKRSTVLNVSSILQRALEDALAEMARHEALAAAVESYESKHRRIDAGAIAAQEERDGKAARRPATRRRAKKNAA